ncbi:hypothetical protein O0L34_g16296 [Tuta absoluta]|nr:hypothetical protein O0L34_g16296 [Tuta absoluta]
MIMLRTVLFLFGTTIASSHVLRNGVPCIHGHGPPKMPPFAMPFIQQGTNLFYKPQFMAPESVIPSALPWASQTIKPEAVTPALTPIEVIEIQPLPSRIEEQSGSAQYVILDAEPISKPLEIPKPPELTALPQPPTPLIVEVIPPNNPAPIPEAPILPSFVMPELPSAPIFPASEIQPASEPKPIEIPEAPVLAPEFVEVYIADSKPIQIPEAPILSSMVLPELPESEDLSTHSNCNHDHHPAPEFKPMAIPEAPVLPPFSMPELPPVIIPVAPEIPEPAPEIQPMNIPEAPILPPMVQPEMPKIEDVSPEPAPALPAAIPEAPVLPPLVMPEFPVIPAAPEITMEVNPATEFKPSIPEPPVLPLFTMPELLPVFIPEIPKPAQEIQPMNIPEAPSLPPMVIPDIPKIEDVRPECEDEPAASEFKPAAIPEAPVLPPFTMPEMPAIVTFAAPEMPKIEEVTPDCEDQSVTPEFKPVAIPEAPFLPPFTIPELPSTPDIAVEMNLEPEFKPAEIPEAPVLPPFTMPELPPVIIPVAPEKPKIEDVIPECEDQPAAPELKPAAIPEAPVLPPFTMPELPALIIHVAPEIQPQPIPEAPILPPMVLPELPALPEIIKENAVSESASDCEDQPAALEPTPAVIPEAPILPPFTMPELPAVIIPIAPETQPQLIPEAPILPPMVLPELPTLPEIIKENTLPESTSDCEDQPAPEWKPMDIPEAPTVPPMFEILKPVEIIRPADEDYEPSNDIEREPQPEIRHDSQAPPEIKHFEPLIIPEAPQLPPLDFPQIPTVFIEPAAVELAPATAEEPSPWKEIPVSPVIPAFTPERIVEVKPAPITMQPIVVADVQQPCDDEAYQRYLQQPTFWAQNIIIERVMPNMIVGDKEQVKSLQFESKYPVITKPYFVQ